MESLFAAIEAHWPAGREDYHWHVLPGTDLAWDRISRHYSELIDRARLASIRPEFMHVTVQHLGPVAEVRSHQLEQIFSLVRDQCRDIAPFAVTIGRAEAWEHAIVCPLRAGHLLTNLWQVTATAAKDVLGTGFAVRPPVYHPHLSLAYATAHVGSEPVRAWLSDSDAAEVPFPVTQLVLVAQRHDGCEITFRVLDQIPLGGASR